MKSDITCITFMSSMCWIVGATAAISLILGTEVAFALVGQPLKRPLQSARQILATKCDASFESFEEQDYCRHILSSALVKMAKISESEFSAKFNKRRIKSVEVRESSIHGAGLGLFATEKIKAGTIISFYPIHILGIDLGETTRRVSIDALGTTHEETHTYMSSDQAYLHHILGNRPLMKADVSKDLGGNSIFLDVDASRPESPGFLSHRINDGSTVLLNTEDGVLSYYQNSRKAKNCVHVPFGPSPLLATVTTRKVKKGEEFLTTYGCSYWLEALTKETGEAVDDTHMTDPIVAQAKGVAMDVLKGMKSVAVTHASEANELCTLFEQPL